MSVTVKHQHWASGRTRHRVSGHPESQVRRASIPLLPDTPRELSGGLACFAYELLLDDHGDHVLQVIDPLELFLEVVLGEISYFCHLPDIEHLYDHKQSNSRTHPMGLLMILLSRGLIATSNMLGHVCSSIDIIHELFSRSPPGFTLNRADDIATPDSFWVVVQHGSTLRSHQ
ncbi:hypothetical protein TorRG33x02_321920 [Trema orientale]|uniref:Uncharacterized protein n=1 Tax=Trema orientale TaxID=63057 RepID=A0A2P5BGJ1_TREOI|nr:hypothetical protein TorRG33x02_321920 [Trema orientale]